MTNFHSLASRNSGNRNTGTYPFFIHLRITFLEMASYLVTIQRIAENSPPSPDGEGRGEEKFNKQVLFDSPHPALSRWRGMLCFALNSYVIFLTIQMRTDAFLNAGKSLLSQHAHPLLNQSPTYPGEQNLF